MQRIHDKLHNGHWIYLYDDDVPILLPCLYCRYTHVTGLSVVNEKKRVEATGAFEFLFKEVEIGDYAQYERGQQLGLFLEWVDYYNHPSVSLAWHPALPAEFINEYINEYLIVEMQKSEVVVNKAIKSLCSYYNWLTYFFDANYKKILMFAENRALARANSKSNPIVKYLLPATRELLYRHTDSLLEEIVLRNGGELGCRTSENRGFYVDDFKADGKMREGLLSLFKKLKESPEKEEFSYHLPSFDAKYGSARTLYISRDQLQLMESYYNTERPVSVSNHLLVSNSNNHTKGEVISKRYGSSIFSKTLKRLLKLMSENPEAYSGFQTLDEANVYHHLRHSFGTDIFHDLCVAAKKNYESITTESRVYIETARRLGHKVDGKHGNQTTKIYIHACGEREALLREVVNA
ncbi:site-specific integrase [Vibrio campbellii]|uniref:site-specific integrase n=1 Tax=Vibrio campbellii TaxID=680 RepID=UPI00142E1BCB|nr:site-specific integrase [Vibrio campbellii]NIY89732.1 site-specific integrase [Vibrio campbellii]NVK69979.1 site-specific integrase [Vibrio campbellii]